MSGIKSALPIAMIAILSVLAMVYANNNSTLLVSFPVLSVVPYVCISLLFVIILNLAMRQALTMYVASIIALITVAHFYLIPMLENTSSPWALAAKTEYLLLSFVSLLPVFGLVTIPAHKVLKSVLYLVGSLIAWAFLSYVIARIEAPLQALAVVVFDNIGMKAVLATFWLSAIEFTLLSLSVLILILLVFKSLHHIYLLAIAIIAIYAIVETSSLHLILFAILGSVLCLFSAIISSRNMAFNDELTGIPGRRSLSQYAEELSSQYTVVMIDIDFFKRFNDKFGHDSGDDVLKLVASKIAKTGNRARAFRYGGEEFTLVFDGKIIDDVRETIEDLRVQLENYPMAIRVQRRSKKSASQSRNRRYLPVKQEIVKVTCSFGIADSLGGSSEFKATLKRADTALYKAKKGGRNCVRTVE